MSKDLLVLADEYAAATAAFARSLALKDGTDSMSPIARDAGDKRAALAEALAALDIAQPVQVNAMLLEALEKLVAAELRIANMSPFPDKFAAESAEFQLSDAMKLARAAIAEVAVCTDERMCTSCFSGQGNCQNVAAQQAQPERAPLSDAKRLDWIRDQLFEHKWNGVVGKGCAVQWVVAPDFRFKQRELTDDSGITAGDFRRAIDAAIKAKESGK